MLLRELVLISEDLDAVICCVVMCLNVVFQCSCCHVVLMLMLWFSVMF